MARLGDVVAFGVQPRTNKQIIGSRASDAMRDFARNPWHRWAKDRGWWRAYPAIVSTPDLFGFTIPTRRRFQNLTWRRARSTSVSIPDTFCRHRLEPKSLAGRCRIVRRGTTFLVARSCSVRLSPHHIHSLARRNIHHRNTGREHHNSHHHNSIALRRCSHSLKEPPPRTGTMQVSS